MASARLANQNHAADVAREAAQIFYEADRDGDGVLEWHEFMTALTATRSRTGAHELPKPEEEAKFRALFDSIDKDQSGYVDMTEYFLWTLEVATAHGSGLDAIFRRYDKSGEGVLDASEFALAVEDMGFDTGFAHNLFVELDCDGSGSISAKELIEALRPSASSNLTASTRKFVTTFAFSKPDEGAKKQGFGIDQVLLRARQAESWNLSGPSPEDLRKQLKATLERLSLREHHLHTVLTNGDRHKLSEERWVRTIKEELGYVADESLLRETFHQIEVDRSGLISMSELRDWLAGRAVQRNNADVVALLEGVPEHVATLESLEWSSDALRRAMQEMCLRHGFSPLDLMRAYDRSHDGQFSRREVSRARWSQRKRALPA